MACASASIYNCMEFAADRRFPEVQQLVSEDQTGSSSSSSTSSIGKNSDESTGGGRDEEEVRSEYKGGPLDSLVALEEVLPVKKSMSKFYSGKSKSFAGLSDAASYPSLQDITKPENEYTRKRKNLLAFNDFLDKNRNMLRSSNGGMSKRNTNFRSMLSLVAAMNCCETNSGETTHLSSPCCGLPPLPPHARRAIHCELPMLPPADKFSSLRSFSLSVLQGAAVSEPSSANLSGSSEK